MLQLMIQILDGVGEVTCRRGDLENSQHVVQELSRRPDEWLPFPNLHLARLFANEDHLAVQVTWAAYQRMVTAYRDPDPARGRDLMNKLIASLSSGVPAALVELRRLGRTLKQRAADVLAYFDRPGTSNGPTEAINGRLEHLRGSALGFRNLTNYIARSLLETGGFRPRLHPGL